MSAASLADLLAALDLVPDGADRFSGRGPAAGWRRVFGGLVAAARTAEGRPGHSLHGSFILPGDPEVPIACAVERLRDGGGFTTRRCAASQDGRAAQQRVVFDRAGSLVGSTAQDGLIRRRAAVSD